MLQLAIERVLANGTGAVSQSVEYPAAADQNVTSGVQATLDTIQAGRRDCPDQQYFLLGYSQGASLMQETLVQLDNESLAAVRGAVLVGNPFRLPGRRSNVDSQGRLDTREAYGLYATHLLLANATVPTYSEDLDQSGKISDICLEVS